MEFLDNVTKGWNDSFAARRVFGEPIEKGGMIIIPVAMIAGGAGGGSGPVPDHDDAESLGAGFGGIARPLGVYVVREDRVEWRPAIDATLLAVAGIALTAVIVRIVGRALRRR